MKAGRVWFAIVAAFLPLLPASAHAATPRTLVAKIECVSDGDTITGITSEGTKVRIRLLGIDAPKVAHSTIEARPSGRFE